MLLFPKYIHSLIPETGWRVLIIIQARVTINDVAKYLKRIRGEDRSDRYSCILIIIKSVPRINNDFGAITIL